MLFRTTTQERAAELLLYVLAKLWYVAMHDLHLLPVKVMCI